MQSENLSQIILTEYKNKSPLQPHSEEFLCDGNDPRVISDGEQAYVLSQGSLHTGIMYTLSILPSKQNLAVRLGEGATSGKNWQPAILDQELFVIDSISPFRLNKLDTNTGIISKVMQFDLDFDLPAAHDDYSTLRGGSNAIIHDGVLYGWGHATIKPYSHIPYLWKCNNNAVSTTFLNLHTFFKNRGYTIVDPASFFEWDEENFALSLSCSQRDWFHPQWFLNAIVIIDKNDFFNTTPIKIENSSIRESILLHAAELDSLIDSVHQNGGLSNNGKQGCLVCGPSMEIDISKKWIVELCYSSPLSSDRLVADFDILLNINGLEQHAASTQIFGTMDKSTRVRLEFNVESNYEKALIQTRVFALKNVSLTCYFFELIYGK